MPSLAEVKRQIAAYPDRYIFWTRKEIRALPNILEHGEDIKALTSGMLNGATWLLVCTNRRLIFLNRGFLWGTEQMQMPLDRIQAIDYEFTLFFGSISVWDGASSFVIGNILKRSILPFVKITEETMHDLRQAQFHMKDSAEPMAAGGNDIASQISKLAALKEKGYLTDAEFQQQKKKLLGETK